MLSYEVEQERENCIMQFFTKVGAFKNKKTLEEQQELVLKMTVARKTFSQILKEEDECTEEDKENNAMDWQE